MSKRLLTATNLKTCNTCITTNDFIMLLFCLQIKVKSGKVSFSLAADTYPSNAYFEKKVTVSGKFVGSIYIPWLGIGTEEGIMFCNIAGEGETGGDTIIDVQPGSKRKLCENNILILKFKTCYSSV